MPGRSHMCSVAVQTGSEASNLSWYIKLVATCGACPGFSAVTGFQCNLVVFFEEKLTSNKILKSHKHPLMVAKIFNITVRSHQDHQTQCHFICLLFVEFELLICRYRTDSHRYAERCVLLILQGMRSTVPRDCCEPECEVPVPRGPRLFHQFH